MCWKHFTYWKTHRTFGGIKLRKSPCIFHENVARPSEGWRQPPWGRSSCSSWQRPHSWWLRHACFQTENYFGNEMSNVKDRTFRQTQLQITNTNIPNLDMVVGNGAECVSGSAPFLCHLVHVSRPSIAFQGLILFAGTPGIRIGDLSHRIYLAKCYFGTPSNRTKHARLHSNFSYLNSQGSNSYL